ncbi:MAG: Asp-tRNA(Asn)/Glu-tRNA(Gln) amidotransferase GatCAB subunit C [Crocinitomicaceae bacterium]|nr:Asp-tRNA(Asn)/Glu-tRNA(Gln) amidotransferase GatCAB subunit C [Crocinitomicaceae bacterium]|tara:strand:- start:110 stop:400 length:291 start_codon:yes stop_codon:yes gene_type:complete
MKVDDELVDRIAELARLKFEGEEKESIKADMQRILDFVSELEEIDTENVEPLIYMTEGYLELRKDESSIKISQNEALSNAPSKDSDYFKVPKVLNK